MSLSVHLDTAAILICISIAASLLMGLPAAIAHFRSNAYRSQEVRDREQRLTEAAAFAVPAPNAELVGQYRVLQEQLAPLHDRAIAFQESYKNALVRLTTCLGSAFVVLALALTIMHSSSRFMLFSGAFDVAAMILALAYFRSARSENKKWVTQRIQVELLRQRCLLGLALVTSDENATRPQINFFDENRQIIEKAFTSDNHAIDLALLAKSTWDEYKRDLLSAPKRVVLNTATVTWYLGARAIRQKSWFKASGERLERQADRKNRQLIAAYFISIVLAFIKTAALAMEISHWEITYSLLTFALLVMIGISSSITAIYANKNERSLRHRYAQQERVIKIWIETVEYKAGETASESEAVSMTQHGATLSHLVAFEDIMNEELIDWIRITMHDSVELSVA